MSKEKRIRNLEHNFNYPHMSLDGTFFQSWVQRQQPQHKCSCYCDMLMDYLGLWVETGDRIVKKSKDK